MKKIPPPKVTNEESAALLAGKGMSTEDTGCPLLVCLAVKRIVEDALEGDARYNLLGSEE